MVSVGHAGAACCESCAQGGHCEGGCGDNCNCGKEGKQANPTIDRRGVIYSQTPVMRMVPSRNPSTVIAKDVIFSPPTTSRLLNRARHRRAFMHATTR